MVRSCNLARCLEPIAFVSVHIDKQTHEVSAGYYCRFDYPEAWDLESLGIAVAVFRLSDWNLMKKRGRIYSKEHRYEKA